MILGFTGKKGSGKTTAVDYLISWRGGVRINFKDALLKELRLTMPNTLVELSKIYNLSIDDLFTQKPPAVRALLQNYGTDVRRNDYENYWVDEWNDTLVSGDVYTDDVRFLNEAETLKKAGGILVRIERIGHYTNDSHSSETEMDFIQVDHTIIADTKENLCSQLDNLLLLLPKEYTQSGSSMGDVLIVQKDVRTRETED